jgi:hypothetical protein
MYKWDQLFELPSFKRILGMTNVVRMLSNIACAEDGPQIELRMVKTSSTSPKFNMKIGVVLMDADGAGFFEGINKFYI